MGYTGARPRAGLPAERRGTQTGHEARRSFALQLGAQLLSMMVACQPVSEKPNKLRRVSIPSSSVMVMWVYGGVRS